MRAALNWSTGSSRRNVRPERGEQPRSGWGERRRAQGRRAPGHGRQEPLRGPRAGRWEHPLSDEPDGEEQSPRNNTDPPSDIGAEILGVTTRPHIST